MLSAARTASKTLLENSRQFSSLTLKSGYNPMLANALAQKYDVRYKSDGEIEKNFLQYLSFIVYALQESKGLLSALTWEQPTPVLL